MIIKKLKMNLQLFNDGEESANTQDVAVPETDGTTEKNSEVDDDVFVDDDMTENDSESDDEGESDVAKQVESENTQNVADSEPDEEPQQPKDENAKYAAARREAENKQKANEKRMNEFAKSLGYNSFDELEQVQEQQKYIDQGYEPEMAEKLMRIDRLEKDMQQRENVSRIKEEKSNLRTQKYFAELEAEIDQHLADVPEASVEVIFNMLKGQNMDKLIAQEKKATKQRALNNMNNKDHIKSDGKGVEHNAVHIDPEEYNIYKKLNPKGTKDSYANWLKQNK